MTFRASQTAVRLFTLGLLLAPAASEAQVYTVGAFSVPGASAEEAAGSSLVSADLDVDFDDDLVVGGKTPTGSGILRAYRSNGRTLTLIQSQTGTLAGQRFGEALAAGHFFHGMVELRTQLAIGSPGGRSTSLGGAVTIEILTGNTLDVVTELEQGLDGMPGADEDGDDFGAALAVGDWNDDGYDDLAIGAPGEDLSGAVDVGEVFVVYGSESGLDSATGEVWSQGSAGVPGVNEPGDQFGFALAAGDFDGDFIDDLAIGAPGEEVSALAGAGAVTILPGSASGLTAAGSVQLYQGDGIVPGTLEAGDRFGEVLAAGRIVMGGTTQSASDLVVGVPHEAVGIEAGAGAVVVLPGRLGGITATGAKLFTQNDLVGALAEAGDHFGGSLAIGSFKRPFYRDLVVGAPDEDHASAADAGVAYIFFGRDSSLSASDMQFVPRQLASETVLPSALFGTALAAPDLDGNGRDDLALGVPGFSTGTPNIGKVQLLFSALFADGFDYGNRDAWSSSVP
ncbi:MAG: hypothetical protein ABIV06_05225 [Thermoanaerobaculia bacterium]